MGSDTEHLLALVALVKAHCSGDPVSGSINNFGTEVVLSLVVGAEAACNPAIGMILQDCERGLGAGTTKMLTASQARGDEAASTDLSTSARRIVALVDVIMLQRSVMDLENDPAILGKPVKRRLAALPAGDVPEKEGSIYHRGDWLPRRLNKAISLNIRDR